MSRKNRYRKEKRSVRDGKNDFTLWINNIYIPFIKEKYSNNDLYLFLMVPENLQIIIDKTFYAFSCNGKYTGTTLRVNTKLQYFFIRKLQQSFSQYTLEDLRPHNF